MNHESVRNSVRLSMTMAGRAQPTNRGRLNSREHFEKLVTELTRCKVGDGTLEIDRIHVVDGLTYKNPHTQYMWERYRAK